MTTEEEIAQAMAAREAAALRMQQAASPDQGRPVSAATTGPENAVIGAIMSVPKFFSGIGGMVQEYEDPTQGTYRPAPIMEAATNTMGMGGLAAMTPGMRGALGAAGGKLRPQKTEAPFPQYAEQYPPVGPPQIKPKDPSVPGGETFEAKLLTPEARQFMNTRTQIQKEMDEGGFTPHFDPEKRFYADPSKYPPRNVDTLTVMPKKEKTLAEYKEFIDTPETRKLLEAAYKRGEKLGNAHDWYAMGQLEKAYIAEYGAKEGRKQFLEGFAVPMAATTSGNNPTANYLMAHYFEYLRGKGQAIPEGHQMPAPVGGRRANVNTRDYESIQERGGYSGLGYNQPKMHNFSRSFIGDLDRAVMDEQMTTGMLAPQGVAKADIDKARTTGFGLVEAPVHQVAKKFGVKPGNVQDVAWAGIKGSSEGPMINVINEAIERTHRLTGMPRDEIVRRGIVRREIPVYGLTPAPIGGLADQREYQQ